MARSKISRVLLLTAVAACTVMMIPADAFSRGGGGGGGGGARGGGGGSRASAGHSRSTTRHGPARSGSTKRSRARASDRRHHDRPSTGRPGHQPARPGTKPGNRHPNEVRYHRWLRRRSGRRYSVAVWNDAGYNCSKVERVDGVSYFYCDGAWFEKVYEGGEVYWVEVEKPD